MIELIELSESGHNHFAKELFESAFPKHERPSWDVIRDRENPNFHILVPTIDDEPIGILNYWTFPEFTFIEHFAIDKEFRNRGLGKASILTFMSQYPDQIIIETELPETDSADHRMEFYTDLGFIRNPQEYWQPSYSAKKLEIEMIIMSKYDLDDEEFEEIKSVIYKEVYGYCEKK